MMIKSPLPIRFIIAVLFALAVELPAQALTSANQFGVYATKQIGLLDLLTYLIPITFSFLGIAGYFFYRRTRERNLAEEKFRTFYAAIEQSPASVVITDFEAKIQYVNPQFTSITGYTAEEVIGKNPRILHSGQTSTETFKELWGNLTCGQAWKGELINRRKNGELYWEETRISPVKMAKGEITHYVAVKIDITERKQANAQRDLLLKIIEEAPDFISTADMQSNLQFLNKAGARLVGLPEDADLSALKIKDMHPEWAARRVLEEGIPAVLEKGYWHGESALLHRNGHETPVSQLLLVHRDATGMPEMLSTVMRDITDRKDYEKQILESEQNLLEILKLSPIAVRIAIGHGHQVVFSNQRYAELIRSEHPVGVDPGNYYAQQKDYEKILESIDRAEAVFNRVIELAIPGGLTVWVLASYMPMKYQDKDAVLGWFYDITQLKQAETGLQNANQRLNLLLDSMAEGSYGVDTSGNCTFVNQSFLDILGYQNENEVIGRHIHELIQHSHADGSPYPADECRIHASLGRNERLHCADEVFWHSLDVQVPVEFWSRPIINEGVLTGGIITFIDITERKQAEEKLRYSEQRFHDVSDASGEYLWEIDANMVYTYLSDRAVDVKGYAPHELLGKTPLELMPEEDISKVERIVSIAIENKAPFKLQHRNRTKSGTVTWEEVNGVPVCDADGQVIGLRGTGLNISERKNMEDQVHQLAFYDTLTRLPNRRLLDERLIQAIAASRRSGRHGALMFLDLDNFKPLNDTHGHGVGDLLLIEVANRLKNCVREIDTVARFGGDEFVVILSDLNENNAASMSQAQGIAEKIRTSLSAPYHLHLISEGMPDSTVEHHCSASIGIAMFIDHEGGPEEIMKRADVAMYEAKETGRNSVHFYPDSDPV